MSILSTIIKPHILFIVLLSPKTWFQRLIVVIRRQGYHQGNDTLFVKRNDGKVVLHASISDMIVMGDDIKEITKLKNMLAKEFESNIQRN